MSLSFWGKGPKFRRERDLYEPLLSAMAQVLSKRSNFRNIDLGALVFAVPKMVFAVPKVSNNSCFENPPACYRSLSGPSSLKCPGSVPESVPRAPLGCQCFTPRSPLFPEVEAANYPNLRGMLERAAHQTHKTESEREREREREREKQKQEREREREKKKQQQQKEEKKRRREEIERERERVGICKCVPRHKQQYEIWSWDLSSREKLYTTPPHHQKACVSGGGGGWAKMGSICHSFRYLPAGIWGHCSQVLVFTSISATQKGSDNETLRAVFSQHLGTLRPPNTAKQREHSKWQIDPALPPHKEGRGLYILSPPLATPPMFSEVRGGCAKFGPAFLVAFTLFLRFPCFFCLRFSLHCCAFFPFFSKDFKVSVERKILVFFGGSSFSFLCQKNKDWRVRVRRCGSEHALVKRSVLHLSFVCCQASTAGSVIEKLQISGEKKQ